MLAVWQRYKAALVDADGSTAVALLSRETIAYYGELLAAALQADRARLDEMPVSDVLTVLVARYEYTARRLAVLDGRGFLQLAVNDGLIDASTTARMDFDSAEVNGTTGKLRTSNRLQAQQGQEMRLEENTWKVHLVPLIREVGRLLDRQADQQGLTSSAFALQIIARGRPDAGAELLKPLRLSA